MSLNTQPREVAKLKGADKKDPQRYRGEVPTNPHGVGNAPEHMSEESKAMWFELEAVALPGVLTASDRYFMEMLSNLLVEYRRDPFKFPISRFTPLISCLSRLGMSPADRQKLAVEKPKTENTYSNLNA